MRAFLVCLTLALSCAARADAYEELYRAAGWAQQRVHFHHALDSARQQYRDNLPPAVFEALVANSERRFEAAAMDRRALQRLRERLADPAPALAFYRSPLGRRLVEAELRASSPAALIPNPAPIGMPTVTRTSAFTPNEVSTSRISQSSAVPSPILILILSASCILTVTPLSITIPAPRLPVVWTESPSIRLKYPEI